MRVGSKTDKASSHPVYGGFDVLEGSGAGPYKIGQRLCQCQPGHGRCVDEPLQWLLSNGGGRTSECKMRLGHHCHIGNRKLHRAHTLLLSHQPCAQGLRVVGEENGQKIQQRRKIWGRQACTAERQAVHSCQGRAYLAGRLSLTYVGVIEWTLNR